MSSTRVAVLGLIVLAACAGCATGTRSIATHSNGSASPATYETPRCEGWYDAAAGACDNLGD